MATWINFKELRESLDFATVLKHYGVELKLNAGGRQHQGFCPLPTHNGKGRSPSFSANLEKGIFQCFGCGAKGNTIDFAARMEGFNPENGDEFRKAAIILKNCFQPNMQDKPPVGESKRAPKKGEPLASRSAVAPARAKTSAVVNAPLDFVLKGLVPNHPYLLNRGLLAATIDHFGLGFCARGLMQGRVAIPLYDCEGRLIGYAGRLVEDAEVNESQPKYRFPAKRQHGGNVYEFHKSLFVYNGHRIVHPVPDLIVVEGFPAVWWLWQAGFENVVGLMGSNCSDAQGQIIADLVSPDGRVWLFPDGDAAGTRCAASALLKLAPLRFVHLVKLADREQPTDCTPEDLAGILYPRKMAVDETRLHSPALEESPLEES